MNQMQNQPREADARAIIEAIREQMEPYEVMLESGDNATTELLVIQGAKGHPPQVIDLKSYRDARRTAPERRKGTAKVTTLDAFVELTKRFADADSAIFVDDNEKAPKLVAVLDYHRRRPESGEEPSPRFGEHRIEYAFPLSDEWKTWTAASKDWLAQRDFAELLEARLEDILDPSEALPKLQGQMARLGFGLAGPSTLLALSRGLTVHVDSKVANVQNLSSGEGQVAFEEQHRASDGAGGPMKIPGGFALLIPVFRAGDAWQVPVRLRYRVRAGSLVWGLVPSHIDTIMRIAIGEVVAKAADGTGLPTYYGTPES